MNSDGSGQTNLSNNSANDQQPAWSPDRTKILFTSIRDGNTPLTRADEDSIVVARLLIENGANTDGIDLSWMDNQ
jgi:Tol biopolymer transport system component